MPVDAALSPDAFLEDVLTQDQNDHYPFHFGAGEQQVATSLWVLATLPALVVPFLSHLFNKTIQFTLVLSTLFLAGLYFVIQYRFSWILSMTQTLQNFYHERI